MTPTAPPPTLPFDMDRNLCLDYAEAGELSEDLRLRAAPSELAPFPVCVRAVGLLEPSACISGMQLTEFEQCLLDGEFF